MTLATGAVPRIRVLDVLRGVAILGTLATNIWIFAGTQDGFSQMFQPRDWMASAGSMLQGVVFYLSSGKFLCLLAILFGVGLQIQYQRCLAREISWWQRALARHFLLFVEGMLHFLLVFEYDILIGYALAGWIAGLLAGKSDRVVLFTFLCAAICHLLLFGLATMATNFAAASREAAAFDQLRHLQMSGGYLSQAQYRLQNFWYFRQESFLVLPLNIALFSLGMLLHRAGVFSTSDEGAMLRSRLAWTGLGIGGTATLLMFSSWDGGQFFARYLAAPVFAVGYLSIISMVMLNTNASGILSAALVSIGRTALSCYVLQNIICSVIFFGWGFGLKGGVGPFATMAIFLVIAAGLAMASGAWLRHRSRGPLEAASHQAMKAMRAA